MIEPTASIGFTTVANGEMEMKAKWPLAERYIVERADMSGWSLLRTMGPAIVE